ncbi:MAG: hypothetical protein V1495_09140, partial [Pseudomonadota bacterium]
ADLIQLGGEIDSGVTGEGLLIGISGATLREESCGFALDPLVSRAEVFKQVTGLQKDLLKGLSLYLHSKPAPPLRELVRRLTPRRRKADV